ncbi:MAG: hypothetical protein ABWX96_02475 [Propionibacteriaceae bacterium]
MSEPLLPPPRRPAPQELRDRIASDLDRTSGRRFRVRYLAAPVAAAALVAVTVLGVSTLSGQRRAEPATPTPVATSTDPTQTPTSSPTPTPTQTPAPTPETPRASESPSAPKSLPATLQNLDVRPLTKTEIARDATACASSDSSPGHVADPTSQYARVQRRAGVDGPGSEVRVLVDQDADLTVACQNGTDPETGGGSTDGLARPSRAVPAVEIADYGTTLGDCEDRDASLVTTSDLYAVDDTVALGRIRLNRGKTKGMWQLTTPLNGLVYFPVALTGNDAWTIPMSFDVQFLDHNGKRVTIQPHGAKGTQTTETQTTYVDTCTQLQAHEEEEIKPPKSDAAGAATCRDLAAEADSDGTSFTASRWKAELVVSTTTEWGAVLSDGTRRFGCSLFPTEEVSRLSADSTSLTAKAFYFAQNPIDATAGASLWAAGRVPQDVTKISYRLPGDRDVAATIDRDGYWMVKYHVDGADIAEGNVSTWDPVVVTVTRPGETLTYRIPFTEKTMCNQISHGC